MIAEHLHYNRIVVRGRQGIDHRVYLRRILHADMKNIGPGRAKLLLSVERESEYK